MSYYINHKRTLNLGKVALREAKKEYFELLDQPDV